MLLFVSVPKKKKKKKKKKKQGASPHRAVVHEWGHLRWGVFDEYATRPEEYYWYDRKEKRYEATRCPKQIQGIMVVPEPEPGDRTRICPLLHEGDCTFELSSMQGSTASIMFHPQSEQVYYILPVMVM